MQSGAERTEIVRVKLPNGQEVNIEARMLGGSQKISSSSQILSLDNLTNSIEGIAAAIVNHLQQVKPTKTSVKLGLEVALESGQLTALIVKGSSKGNLEITMEWAKEDIPTRDASSN
ncbi:CU044_2847 family protein [Kamptonema formosum]|uniref:CU044_2847 family protein n=1 Tax=Kamptonema formosum TaxID=331992 RepID=UPI00037B9BBF|nr:CU044_2847 family protein [Oscillatoria sp. PCC 10802]